MENVKDAIIKELVKSLVILGAKSDLLCTACSFGDTLSDEEVLADLKVWNKAHD